jgi:hypothetical protein
MLDAKQSRRDHISVAKWYSVAIRARHCEQSEARCEMSTYEQEM